MENNIKPILDPIQLISRISNIFLTPGDEGIDRMILEALTIITRFFNIDRAYIYRYLTSNKIVMTHECSNKDIEPEINASEKINIEKDLPWLNKQINLLEDQQPFFTANLSTLQEAKADIKFLRKGIFKSVFFIPMVYDDQLIGILGIDSSNDKFDEKNIKTLQIISNIFCSALEREKREREYLLSKLTSGEKDIFDLYIKGMKAPEIGQERDMYPDSVHVIASRIKKKLQIGKEVKLHDWVKHYYPFSLCSLRLAG